ncbi:MAG TPA: DUF3857 and transglutaminase domain-containing protein [Terriglobales bacterium]|nr:DUF3857 and transglutaminase domain-containing protein [Terriglobales bacterium]
MSRAATRIALCATLALTILVATSYARVNVPDWVRQAASQAVPPLPTEVKGVWLLDETDYKVTGPGEYIEHSRTVLKILRPGGRKYGALSIGYQKGEKVNLAHAWVIDASGNEFEVKDKDFVQKGRFSFELYSDEMQLAAQAPALGPGTIVGFEWERRTHEYINELGWEFQGELPVLESVLRLDLPPGWEYRTAWSSGSPINPAATGSNAWEWHQKNIPGIDDDIEPMMPPAYVLAGRMSIAYFAPGQESRTSASWPQVGQWYSALLAERTSPTPEIAAKVNQLVAGKLDFQSRLRTLAEFLQSEIRYVAISIGIGGNQPHSANEVFHSRYGDCKDKATLLKAMLQVVGIRSYLVLVNSDRGFINPDVPSSWGNHAILAVVLPDDIAAREYRSVVTSKTGTRYIIFDPTDEFTPVGSLRSELQDTYALIVTDNGGELVHTPVLAPDWNLVTREGHFTLDDSGALSGEVSEDRSGDSARAGREELHYTDERQRTSDFEHWLSRSIQGFTLTNVEFKHSGERDKDLILDYKISAPQFAQTRGPLMLVRPRVLDDKSASVEHKSRHYPIELGSTRQETDVYEIELPKGYVVDDVPSPVKVDVGFAAYESKIELEGRKLRYWRQLTVRELTIQAKQYPEWTKLQGAIGADEDSVAILKRSQ